MAATAVFTADDSAVSSVFSAAGDASLDDRASCSLRLGPRIPLVSVSVDFRRTSDNPAQATAPAHRPVAQNTAAAITQSVSNMLLAGFHAELHHSRRDTRNLRHQAMRHRVTDGTYQAWTPHESKADVISRLRTLDRLTSHDVNVVFVLVEPESQPQPADESNLDPPWAFDQAA